MPTDDPLGQAAADFAGRHGLGPGAALDRVDLPSSALSVPASPETLPWESGSREAPAPATTVFTAATLGGGPAAPSPAGGGAAPDPSAPPLGPKAPRLPPRRPGTPTSPWAPTRTWGPSDKGDGGGPQVVGLHAPPRPGAESRT